jgi:Ca2+:H+ antiporter
MGKGKDVEADDLAEESLVVKKKEEVDLLADGFWPYFGRCLSAVFFENWMNLLMLTTPFAIVWRVMGWSDGAIFFFSLIAIAPFAERLSFVTEQLALHTSETVGGLLNATFGNVTELIVSIFALTRHMYRIVQVSLIGSILSNLLLVLGCAFLVGGIYYPKQTFNNTSASVNAVLLVVAVFAYMMPMMLETSGSEPDGAAASLMVSRSVSALLLLTYAGFIYFQLVSHTHLFVEDDGDDDDDDDKEEEDDEKPILGPWGAVFWLAVITVFISFLSEFMVDALEEAAKGWGVPDLFLGTIIIPIVGNAAEHAAAIIFAAKNKMELALGIAVGSSIQIAIFAVPLLVMIAWTIDMPLSMNFGGFETGTVLITVLLVGFIIQNGESNWMQGVVLVIAYCALSAGFFVHKDPNAPAELEA